MASPQRIAFWRGLAQAMPFVPAIVPFGLLFGIVGAEAGLRLSEVMGFSIFVVAGASQFAAVQMLSENAPTLIILLTSLAVNLRLAMYSAGLVPHLAANPQWVRAVLAYLIVDQSYAAAAVEYDRRPDMTMREKLAFFTGLSVPILPFWYGCTWLGATLGSAIPPDYALDFAMPITFLALFGPMLRSIPHLVTAGVSVAAALGLAWMPYNSGLLVAAGLALLAGATTEIHLERRAAR